MKQCLTFCLLLLVLLGACRKSNTTDNPFDDPKYQAPTGGNTVDTLPLTNFAGLHQRVFKPTCSNSGCHDGTFEPDFRTIESAYNTMVYQAIIKNNPAGSFLYRVLPGDASASVLHERMVADIDGISGIMPLSLDPQSDWPTKKTEYIAAIATWINAGARDMFGNPPPNGPVNPRLQGMQYEQDRVKLAFMDGVPEAVLFMDRAAGQVFRRVPQAVASPTKAANLFGEAVPFTHEVLLNDLPAGRYFVWTPDALEPADLHIQNRLRLDVY